MKWNLLGHDWAVEILQKHIQNDSVRHAYLFCGTPGIGRRSLAIKFAQAINCVQPPQPGIACGVCRICKQTEKLQLPDLSIVQLEEDKNEIRIEQIRELQKSLSLTPYEAKFRIAMIINFQLANPNAQNALLKTLEEAPPKVILLITADAVENLLPTISSRCEILRLRPMPIKELIPILQKDHQMDIDSARELAHLSSGRFGLIQHYIQNPQKHEQIYDWLSESFSLFSKNYVELFHYVEKNTESRRRSENKETIHQILQTWLLLWRDLLLLKNNNQSSIAFIHFLPWSQNAVNKLQLDEIFQFVVILEKSLDHLDNNVNIRLLLENIMLKWPKIDL